VVVVDGGTVVLIRDTTFLGDEWFITRPPDVTLVTPAGPADTNQRGGRYLWTPKQHRGRQPSLLFDAISKIFLNPGTDVHFFDAQDDLEPQGLHYRLL
jgi:hypothetical protein